MCDSEPCVRSITNILLSYCMSYFYLFIRFHFIVKKYICSVHHIAVYLNRNSRSFDESLTLIPALPTKCAIYMWSFFFKKKFNICYLKSFTTKNYFEIIIQYRPTDFFIVFFSTIIFGKKIHCCQCTLIYRKILQKQQKFRIEVLFITTFQCTRVKAAVSETTPKNSTFHIQVYACFSILINTCCQRLTPI